jgi:hypothetical protein
MLSNKLLSMLLPEKIADLRKKMRSLPIEVWEEICDIMPSYLDATNHLKICGSYHPQSGIDYMLDDFNFIKKNLGITPEELNEFAQIILKETNAEKKARRK